MLFLLFSILPQIGLILSKRIILFLNHKMKLGFVKDLERNFQKPLKF